MVVKLWKKGLQGGARINFLLWSNTDLHFFPPLCFSLYLSVSLSLLDPESILIYPVDLDGKNQPQDLRK